MNNHTNLGLVAHAQAALQLATAYMWGGILRPITTSLVDRLSAQYPTHYSTSRKQGLLVLTKGNYYGVDCVGLIKSYYWGGVGSPRYSSSTDVDANSMHHHATVKGIINNMPETPGLCVWMEGHIGIYIGGGRVIEATRSSYGDGVVETALAGRGWTHWLQCPAIDYITEEDEEMNQEKFESMYKTMIAKQHGDNPSSYEAAQKATKKAKAAGIFGGDGAGNFEWHEPVTREEMAIILDRIGALDVREA